MGLKTVERIGPLLDLFTAERQDWELGEIATALGLPRSTAHGLLRSLVTTGLLASPARGRYQLGSRISALNDVLSDRVDLRAEASEAIRRLSVELGETVNLGVLRGSQVVYLDKVPGHQHVTVIGARVGTQVDANRSAMGKALLAFAAPEIRSNLALTVLPGSTESTLSKTLATIRRQGFATDLGEIAPEIRCVAAPIRNSQGHAVAAISISTTVMRFDRRHTTLVDALLATAATIEKRLTG